MIHISATRFVSHFEKQFCLAIANLLIVLCLIVLCLIVLGAIRPAHVQAQTAKPNSDVRRPNVLLIYTDDHSYKTVRCDPESYPWVRTSNIDSLAKSGVRFRGAYLGSWCMPSRATLLTGRHPHGIESMRMEGTYPGSTYDPKQTPFWPSVMPEAK